LASLGEWPTCPLEPEVIAAHGSRLARPSLIGLRSRYEPAAVVDHRETERVACVLEVPARAIALEGIDARAISETMTMRTW
jgi:hypothetical protein